MKLIRPNFRSIPLLHTCAVLAVLMFGLQGCGGGGGGSNGPGLTISLPTALEGDAGNVELVFTVTLSEDAKSALTLDYATRDGSATVADDDYIAATGSIMIPEGSRTASVSVFANGDNDYEADETFDLVVSNAQGIQLDHSSYSGQGIIENDDDAEPKGYYTGTANVNSVTLDDLTGMMYDNRLLMFSPSANVLYDITFTSITVESFTATAQVYVNGDINDPGSLVNLDLSGTTDESSIMGNFTGGSGLGDGSFTLSFDSNNNVGATIDRIMVTTGTSRWGGDIYGVEVSQDVGRFVPANDASYIATDQGSPSCQYSGTLVIPSGELNIFQLAHDVEELHSCQYISASHTGFASVISLNGVDTLVYAFANGSYSFFAIMEKI